MNPCPGSPQPLPFRRSAGGLQESLTSCLKGYSGSMPSVFPSIPKAFWSAGHFTAKVIGLCSQRVLCRIRAFLKPVRMYSIWWGTTFIKNHGVFSRAVFHAMLVPKKGWGGGVSLPMAKYIWKILHTLTSFRKFILHVNILKALKSPAIIFYTWVFFQIIQPGVLFS